MITLQSVQLRKPIGPTLKGKIESHAFTVGILEEKKRKKAAAAGQALGYFSGGPVRKTAGTDKLTNSEVSTKLRSRLGFNYLIRPFRQKNSDAVRMLDVFFDICFDENPSSKYRRLENLLQAIIRNPFTRKEYGHNSLAWVKEKGFDRLGIDTGQLFKAMKAKVFRQ